MADYTPKPPITQKNHPPLIGQWSAYREENGDLMPCIIHNVLEKSPDGKYYSVVVSILFPNKPPHPGKVERCGHIYWTDLGLVTDDPCPPPWPG